MRVILGGKYAGDKVNCPFDFSSYLAPTEVISSTTQTVSVYSGVDVTPVVLGAPILGITLAMIAASGGTIGNIYDIAVTATTNLGQRISLNAFLPILPGQP